MPPFCLQGILRGCWIVSVEWVFASLEEGRWADEEAFERTDFSPAVRECRLSRQAFGPSLYRSRLLEDAGAIYVDRRGCSAPADQGPNSVEKYWLAKMGQDSIFIL